MGFAKGTSYREHIFACRNVKKEHDVAVTPCQPAQEQVGLGGQNASLCRAARALRGLILHQQVKRHRFGHIKGWLASADLDLTLTI